MNNVTYSKTSPYAFTETFGKFLDVARLPSIPKNPDDVAFSINRTYVMRPDLLAFDLYGDATLWWVFAIRNPNVIKDPIFDMQVGKTIYLPKKTTLLGILG